MQISRYWRMKNWLLRLSTEPVTYQSVEDIRALVIANEERVMALRAEQERLKIAEEQTEETGTPPQEVAVAVA